MMRARSATRACLALALHVAGLVLSRDNHELGVEYHREAARLAAETGAKLIEGYALTALASTLARQNPAAGARALVDVMAHYLRVGNRNHLRSFGRSLIRPLIEIGLDEAAAVVDGATSDQPEWNEMITGHPATSTRPTHGSAPSTTPRSHEAQR